MRVTCTRSYARCNSGSMKLLLGQSALLSICKSKTEEAACRATVLPFGCPPRLRSPRGACMKRYVTWAATQAQVRSHPPRRRHAHEGRSDLDLEQPAIRGRNALNDLPPSRVVGLRPPGDRKRNWWLEWQAVGINDKHPSRGDLSLLQRRVRHGVEPVGAFVSEDKTASRIKAIVGASDSEEGHGPGVCACAPLCRVLRQVVRAISRRPVVVTLEYKIIAEEPPLAHRRRRGRLHVETVELVYKNFDLRHFRHLSLKGPESSSVSGDVG